MILNDVTALNHIAIGGKWKVNSALDIAGTTESTLILEDDTRHISVNGNADYYLTFGIGTDNVISTVNDLYYASASNHLIKVPHNIGNYNGSTGPVLHVRQVGTVAAKTVRVIER